MGAYFECGYPRFCPSCGGQLSVVRDDISRDNWQLHLAHQCKCGTEYIKVERCDLPERILEELERY